MQCPGGRKGAVQPGSAMEELSSIGTETVKEPLATKRGEKRFFGDDAVGLWPEQGCAAG